MLTRPITLEMIEETMERMESARCEHQREYLKNIITEWENILGDREEYGYRIDVPRG